MHTALISLAVCEKADRILKNYIVTGYKIWGKQSYTAVPMGTYQPGMAWRIGHLCTHQIDQSKEETRYFGLDNDCWGWIMCQLKPSAGCCYKDFGLHNGPTPKQGRYGGYRIANKTQFEWPNHTTPPKQISW